MGSVITSCNESKPYAGDPQWSTQQLHSADGREKTQMDQSALIKKDNPLKDVKMTIRTIVYDKVYQGPSYLQPIKLSVSHPTDQWIIRSVIYGGKVKDNLSDNPDQFILGANHMFVKDLTTMTVILRNLSLCKKFLTEAQCQGKHTLRPISENLESIFLFPIKAHAPTGAIHKLEAHEIEDQEISAELYLYWLEYIHNQICVANTDGFKLSFTNQDKLMRSSPHLVKTIQSIGEKDFVQAMIDATNAIDTYTDDQTPEMKKTGDDINRKLQECLETHTQWLKETYTITETPD